MAPLLKLIVQWLSSLPASSRSYIPSIQLAEEARLSSSHAEPLIVEPTFVETYPQQQPIGLMRGGSINTQSTYSTSGLISTVSWGPDRQDVFTLQGNNLTHKAWDGSQWIPNPSELEVLGNGLATPPAAITWGVDRLDVFGLDDNSVFKHQYWDGTAWQPSTNEFENLGGGCDGKNAISASTWGPGRLDLFCRGPDGDLLHQYYDGSNWQPSQGSLESLSGSITSGPSVVSWGENRLDIFAFDDQDKITHLYWDGNQWSKWETFDAPTEFQRGSLSVTSWGPNRLDIFVLGTDGSLWHKYWDGSQWPDWELLGEPETPLQGNVGVANWAPDRLDIVGLGNGTGHYLYKYYDGASWQPSTTTWYDKGPERPFSSSPSVVSWGVDRLDIFGDSVDGKVLHQAWTGEGWYPESTVWECLGYCFES
ncbi:MAG: hypothetical protein Q9218_005879 [Villophora microphyllina]